MIATSPVDWDITLEPKAVLTVVVIETAILQSIATPEEGQHVAVQPAKQALRGTQSSTFAREQFKATAAIHNKTQHATKHGVARI